MIDEKQIEKHAREYFEKNKEKFVEWLLADRHEKFTGAMAGGANTSPEPSAEVETVEVVAVAEGEGGLPDRCWRGLKWAPGMDPMDVPANSDLMTVAQHQRIVAAKDAEIERLNEGFFRANKDALGVALERDELRAKLAVQQAAVPVYTKPDWRDNYGYSGGYIDYKYAPDVQKLADHFENLLDDVPEGPLYAACPAAPQQGVSVPEALLRRLVQGKPQDHESRAEGAALLREFARLNADRSAQGGE